MRVPAWSTRPIHCSHIPHSNFEDTGGQCFGSVMISMRIRIQYLNAYQDQDPDSGSQPMRIDPGQTLKSQKLNFYMKNILLVCTVRLQVKKHTYKVHTSFWMAENEVMYKFW